MKLLFWLLLLVACQQPAAAQSSAPAALTLTEQAAPAVVYTSGDRLRNGAHDTLRVGRGTVLHLKPGSKQDFDEFQGFQAFKKESYYLQQEKTGVVRRSNNTLRLQPRQGPPLRLVNNTYQMRGDENEERDIKYKFTGSISGNEFWLVVKTQWEVITYLLVSKLTGKITRLWGPPVVSPNYRYAFAQSLGLETSMAPNGLQLVVLAPQGARLQWTRRLRHWEPYRLHWLGNQTVAIEQQRFAGTGESKLTYVRLSLAPAARP